MLDANELNIVTDLVLALKQLNDALTRVTQLTDKLASSTNCAVVLQSMGPNKIACIRAVREITAWGLKESKDFVEAAPRVLPRKDLGSAPPAEAVQRLIDAGAEAILANKGNCEDCESRFICFTTARWVKHAGQ